MVSEQVFSEQAPVHPDLAAVRAQACRLLLMSRGMYILMGGVFLVLFGVLQTARIPDRVRAIGLPILATLLLLAFIAIQRWRRERGLGITVPSALTGQRPGTPGFRRAIKVMLCLIALGMGAGLVSAWLPLQVFNYVVVAWCVALALYLLWRWHDAHAWETWILAAGLMVTALLLVSFGLDQGGGRALLAAGIGGIMAGLSLEIRWIRWVRNTRTRLAEGPHEEVPS